jgi:hypothetical protein
MGDLEHVDLRDPGIEEERVDVVLRVAHEQEPVPAGAPEQDHGDVVRLPPVVRGDRWDSLRVGPQDCERDVVDEEAFAPPERRMRDRMRREGRLPCRVARSLPGHPRLEDAAHASRLQECHEAGHVVLVGMGEHDRVDGPVPRRELLIEGDEEAGRIGAAVHEQRPAAPADDEDRIALTDVEGDHPCDTVRAVGDSDAEDDDRRAE